MKPFFSFSSPLRCEIKWPVSYLALATFVFCFILCFSASRLSENIQVMMGIMKNKNYPSWSWCLRTMSRKVCTLVAEKFLEECDMILFFMHTFVSVETSPSREHWKDAEKAFFDCKGINFIVSGSSLFGPHLSRLALNSHRHLFRSCRWFLLRALGMGP